MITEPVLRAWATLKEGLERISRKPSYLGSIARDLLKIMNRFGEGEGGVIIYCPFTLIEEDGSYNEALTIKLGGERTDIIITPKALSSQKALLETLIHELLHVAGAISENEDKDEEITEYLTKLIILELSIDAHEETLRPSTATKEIPQRKFEENPAHYLKECIEVNLSSLHEGGN